MEDIAPARTARPGEVARMLKIDVATVSRYAKTGKIPCDVTPSGHRRYNLEEVRLALAGSRVTRGVDASDLLTRVAAAEADAARLRLALEELGASLRAHLLEDERLINRKRS
jgi:predicted site-specific integrase-resolvase